MKVGQGALALSKNGQGGAIVTRALSIFLWSDEPVHLALAELYQNQPFVLYS